MFDRLPGTAVGAPGAFTLGENRFPPVGLMDFSVGSTGGGGGGVSGGIVVVVVVVVGVVVSGACCPVPQAAVNEINPKMAAPPAATESRRANCPDFMMLFLTVPRSYPEYALRIALRSPVSTTQPRTRSHPARSGARTLTLCGFSAAEAFLLAGQSVTFELAAA